MTTHSDDSEAGSEGDGGLGGATRPVTAFLWTALSWGGNKVVVLGLTLLLARLLTPADFGVVTAALTLIAILDAALDLGVGAAVVADQEQGVTRRVRTAAALTVLVSLTVLGVGVAAAPLMAALFGVPGQSGLFAVMFVYPLLRGLGQVSDGVLKRDLRFRPRTLVDLARALVRVAVSVPLALGGAGAWSIALGIVAAEAVAVCVLWALAPVRPEWRLRAHDVRELLSFGGSVTGVRLLGSLRSNVDYLVVGNVLGAAALGYYGMAFRLPELVLSNVLWIFSTVAFPLYARAAAEGTLMAAMVRAMRLVTLYGLTAGAALAVVSRDAMLVLFSDAWRPAVVPMALIAGALGLLSVGWASGDVFSAIGRPGLLLALDVPATIIVTVAFVTSQRWGIVGVAAVHLGFEAAYALCRLALARHVTGVPLKTLVGALGPGAACAVTVSAVGWPLRAVLPSGTVMSLIALCVVCAVVALATAWLTARADLAPLLAGLAGRLPGRRARPQGA